MSAIPRFIGKYEIRRLLGEGATSIVYEGFDPAIKRRVAIKILRDNLTGGDLGEELLARFRREAISAARCMHPNIVTIHDYGEQGNTPFIVMEYVDGISVHRLIRHRLQHRRGISLRRSLSIISQLLKALHTAHGHGIVHRDVKASNVLILKHGGRVKLADFGMARLHENSDLTMVGSLIGTPRFMAPELRLGLEADLRADVFSAARLLLELLRMLPQNSRVPRARLPVMHNMPPGNRIDYSVGYPSALIPVLLRGLEPDRGERYQSAYEFMRAIKMALPEMQRKKTTPAGNPVVIATPEPAPEPKPAPEEYPASEDELESMTTLLSDFLGPIASIVMEEHETRSASAANLAVEIAREIPEQNRQIEFLQRWEQMSRSRQAYFSRNRPEDAAYHPQPERREPGIVEKIGDDFMHYIGPIGKTLLRHYSSITSDPDQLVKFLGREIPDRKQGKKFVKSWSHD